MALDGYGNISWWGFSPSFNIIQSKSKKETLNSSGDNVKGDLNVLLVNNHDPRIIIDTVCNEYSEFLKTNKITFYVVEPFLEQIGRFMLLLSVAFDPDFGLQERVENYLEIFGNSLLRMQNAQYIVDKANLFISLVTDLDLFPEKFPLCDISALKHKERDYLEGVFKFWREGIVDKNYEINKIWDGRVRSHLGVRYDTKENAFDWDRCMKLSERGASIIHSVEYETFRSKGVAFESRSGDYNFANRSLSSPAIFADKTGDRVIKRGYFGDIITGPFICYGVESDNKELFKKQNNMYGKMSLDIATYNLTEMFKKLSPNETEQLETIVEVTEEIEENSSQFTVSDRVSVKFIHAKDLTYLYQKQKFDQFFDHVFLASDSAGLFTADLHKILKKSSTVFLESPKFIVDLKQEQVGQVLEKLLDNGKNAGFKTDISFDKEKPFELNRLSFTADSS